LTGDWVKGSLTGGEDEVAYPHTLRVGSDCGRRSIGCDD
jgi:hypothetical protein